MISTTELVYALQGWAAEGGIPERDAPVIRAFLTGMRATVQAVVHDVDGGVHVAVSVDADPAAELQTAHGRFRYFRPDELEPVP